MITTMCAICEKKQKLVEVYPETIKFKEVDEKTFSARRTPDRMHYCLVKCTRCGLIFSNPILERNKIDKLYRKSLFFYGDESEYLKKTYKYYLERALKGRNKNKLKLLDIGCGNGFFLEEMKNSGIESVFGIEPSQSAVNKSPKSIRKNIKVSILKPNLFKDNFFDIICCFHTLDHITDPNTFLKICLQLLKKGGAILFIVHDTDGLSVKLFGEKSAIFDIEHIYLFNPKTLKAIFSKNSFTKLNTFNITNQYPINYWFRMVPMPKIIKNLLLSFLKTTGIGKIALKVAPGNIGITAVK